MDLLQRHPIRHRKTILKENNSDKYFSIHYRNCIWSAHVLGDGVALFYTNKHGTWINKYLEFRECNKFKHNDWIRIWRKLSTTTTIKVRNKKRVDKKRSIHKPKTKNYFSDTNIVGSANTTRCNKPTNVSNTTNRTNRTGCDVK